MSPLGFHGLLVLLLVPKIWGNTIPLRDRAEGSLTSRSNDLNQSVGRHGYKAEEYIVVTEDAYVLTLFRIKKGVRCQEIKKRTPVLLMHGLLLNADCWIDAGPDAGLAYLLADACFDTWIGSVRGSHYSRKHIRLNPDRDKKFWEFSVDEIGLYDIPAMIDYILSKTRQKQLNYIGFSQGAGTFFVMCSEKPGYCHKSKVLIALAPATRHLYTKSLLFRLVPQLIMHQRKLLDALGMWELFARRLPLYEFLSNVCQYEQALSFCEWVLAMFDASHPGSITTDTLKRLFRHILAGTSTQNIARYGQSTLNEQFYKFNFGKLKNNKVYGKDSPAVHNLTAVNVPVAVIYGKNDGVVDEKDVKWLVSKLPNVKEVITVKDQYWNHLDMTFSQYINVMVFPSISKYLMQYD